MNAAAAIPARVEFQGIERAIEGATGPRDLLALAERILELWVEAHGAQPTREIREGFRLLALHHQGTRGIPSFNACRETCREVAYHYNLITLAPDLANDPKRLEMMAMVVRHLALFVGGKVEVEGLGDFCCASRPLRQESASPSGRGPG